MMSEAMSTIDSRADSSLTHSRFTTVGEKMPVNYRKQSNVSFPDEIEKSKPDEFAAMDESPHSILSERNSLLKKEEALRDKLKLQETLNSKHVQELRSQVKKLTVENNKLLRTSRELPPPILKTERRRESKIREVRDLNKTIESLRAENKGLLERVLKLSNFIQVASELKNTAIQQCAAKDEHIRSVEEQKRFSEQQRIREKIKRIKIESEVHSLRSFIEQRQKKNKELSRNKSIQTDISLPFNYNIPSLGHSPRNIHTMSSFANIVASHNILKFKQVESNFQKQSHDMKEKFAMATSIGR